MGRRRAAERIFQGVVSLILFVLIFFTFSYVQDIQGTARVVNYAGLVRGETQRVVKLEIAGVPSPQLVQELDGFVDGLQNGSPELNLISIDDAAFQAKVADLAQDWESLKQEIEQVRQVGWQDTDILARSEGYFALSDEVVSLAEAYSQQCASTINLLEYAVAAAIAVLLLLMLYQSLNALRVMRSNRELNKKVYVDEQTKLPNKTRCLQLMEDPALITQPTCVFMFDLNNLKYVNDTFGHDEGDQLICNFAQVIRQGVPPEHFVGRYGGDEFIAVVTGPAAGDPTRIVGSVQALADAFNAKGEQNPLSYAVGYACFSESDPATLQTLLSKADKYMYINKHATKHQNNWLDELEYQATHDGLTGLYSKTYAFNKIERKIQGAPDTYRFAMLVFDIDDFKVVNDTAGHAAGDDVLVWVSKAINSAFRTHDVVARFGGDEFFTFIAGEISADLLEAKVSGIMGKVLQRNATCGGHVITISTGGFITSERCSAQELFDRADKALYEAKNGGKNRYVLHR